MKKFFLMFIILLVVISFFTGCDRSEIKYEEVSISGEKGTIRVNIPEGWSYELYYNDGEDRDSLMLGEYGIYFHPENVSKGYIRLVYTEQFGTCGVGLTQHIVSVADEMAYMGKYNTEKSFSFILFKGKNEGVAALSYQCGDWLKEYEKQVLKILDTVKFENEEV